MHQIFATLEVIGFSPINDSCPILNRLTTSAQVAAPSSFKGAPLFYILNGSPIKLLFMGLTVTASLKPPRIYIKYCEIVFITPFNPG